MLAPNRLRRLLAEGHDAFGLFCAIPAPVLVEMIGVAGYDFVIIDTEHTLLDPQRLEDMVRAAEAAGSTPLVRVPPRDPNAVLRALDAGAMGVVVPHVSSRADVEEIVAAARYVPQGRRALAGGRTTGFGRLDPVAYLRAANAEVMVVPMIEDATGVEAVEEILTGGGVDAVLPGPGDLSASYGVPWQTRDPAVQDALHRVAQACARHGVPFLAMARTPEARDLWRGRGVRAFVLGEERDIAATALRARLAEHRRE